MDTPGRRHWMNLLVASVAIGLLTSFAVWTFASAAHHFESVGEIVHPARRLWWTYRDDVIDYFSAPWIFAGIPLAFLCTYLRPAIATQALFSREVIVDLLWTLLQKAVFLTLIVFYFDFLEQLFDTHLSFLVVPMASEMSAPARFLAGYLVADFLGWAHHLVRHKVPFFWSFHQLHHAQTELNPFSRERVHALDYLFAQNIRFVPLLAFQNSFEILVAYFALHTLQDTFNHSNVRTDFGPLRYLFVSPQFHRIHHSTEERHFDSNFGVSLAIWDRLFGTASRDVSSYPATGVPDPTWPPNAKTLGDIPGAMWRQFCHPFVSAARTLQRSPAPQGTRM